MSNQGSCPLQFPRCQGGDILNDIKQIKVACSHIWRARTRECLTFFFVNEFFCQLKKQLMGEVFLMKMEAFSNTVHPSIRIKQKKKKTVWINETERFSLNSAPRPAYSVIILCKDCPLLSKPTIAAYCSKLDSHLTVWGHVHLSSLSVYEVVW